MSEPYHKYVFDLENRRFVGQFEDMYRGEHAEGYDSWHQDDMNTLSRRVALAVLAERQWKSILDVGCGKGAFTGLLKTPDNRVVGVDLSETAVAVARERNPEVEFKVLEADRLAELGERFELVTVLETLSYIESWREVLSSFAGLGDWLFVSLYLPPDPIGFVKSFDELREAVSEAFEIRSETVVGGDQIHLLAEAQPR
jgi:SAM-dependent methyltransferase